MGLPRNKTLDQKVREVGKFLIHEDGFAAKKDQIEKQIATSGLDLTPFEYMRIAGGRGPISGVFTVVDSGHFFEVEARKPIQAGNQTYLIVTSVCPYDFSNWI